MCDPVRIIFIISIFCVSPNHVAETHVWPGKDCFYNYPSQQHCHVWMDASILGSVLSVLLCLVDVIQTTVFARSLLTFTYELWMIRGGTLVILAPKVNVNFSPLWRYATLCAALVSMLYAFRNTWQTCMWSDKTCYSCLKCCREDECFCGSVLASVTLSSREHNRLQKANFIFI